MKTIKNVVKITSIPFSILFLFACASSQNNTYSFEENPPFTIVDSYSQKWVAGIPEGGSGLNVSLSLGMPDLTTTFTSLYFRNRIADVKLSSNNMQLTANFKDEKNRDIIMDSDPMKEANNTPPVVFPFTLEQNEAVLSYTKDGEVKYYRIPGIIEKPILAYPSINREQ